MVRKLLTLVVLVAIALLATGCHRGKVSNPIADINSKQPDKVLYDRAMEAMKSRKFDIARLSLQTLINTYPDSEYIARAKLSVGDSWYAEGGSTGLAQAEIEVDGGLSPRVAPFVDVRDAGALLQRAGFAEPVADIDSHVVRYARPLKLFADLRGMGETNVLSERRRTFFKRTTLMRACQIYLEKFRGSDDRVPATFQILYLSGKAATAG